VDANQMLALLASNQIEGAKKTDKSGSLVLQVEKGDFVKAVEVLRQNGYPRRAYRAVDELFPSGQLVSSPTQEQAKIRFLREQSLERMLSNIEGVISANVVIADSENGDKSDNLPSASVLVKYSPEVNLRALGGQLKNLIHNALPGVNQERISLVVQPVDYRFVAPQVQASESVATTAGSAKAKDSGFAGLSLWTLLAFWLVSTLAIVGHGLWKHRRQHQPAVGARADGK
jgi:type III secretion protein J